MTGHLLQLVSVLRNAVPRLAPAGSSDRRAPSLRYCAYIPDHAENPPPAHRGSGPIPPLRGAAARAAGVRPICGGGAAVPLLKRGQGAADALWFRCRQRC